MLEPIDVAELLPVLEEADSVYMAIRSRSGPHVTPELFTVSGDRIICLTSASTLKARTVRNGDVVGICASSASGSVVLTGSLEIVDPMSLRSALEAPAAAVQAPLGVARFLRDNASEMVGATFDALAGRLGRPLPSRRVVLTLTPVAAIRTEGEAVRFAKGWEDSPELGATPSDDRDEPAAVDLDELPGRLGDFAVSGPAVIGWLRGIGAPISLPVTWDANQMEAMLPLTVFNECGAVASGPACVTFQGWTGYGPSGKHGVMLRGAGIAARDGDAVRIAMRVARASYWDGIATGTVDVASPR